MGYYYSNLREQNGSFSGLGSKNGVPFVSHLYHNDPKVKRRVTSWRLFLLLDPLKRLLTLSIYLQNVLDWVDNLEYTSLQYDEDSI